MNYTPFIKWAGGKTQLIPGIEANFPRELKTGEITKYVEPFIGGGALFFYLASHVKLTDCYINDVNKRLINVYNVITYNVNSLISALEDLSSTYLSLSIEQKESFFYNARKALNTNKITTINQAALFIFLNKTCFNGLYRVNKSDKFNSPFGKYKNPKIYDKDNLLEISKLLSNVNISCVSFESTESFVDKDTFVYFDPPYRPLSETASFNAFQKVPFNDDSQRKLADYFRKLDKIGAKLMLSNSDPKNINENDNFFDDLYAGYNIKRVYAKRCINSNKKKRGNISELLITNY